MKHWVFSVKTVHDRTGYFAEQLYKSMKGLGTDDRSLIRIVTSRSEIDLEDIKESFLQKYGQTLAEWVIVSINSVLGFCRKPMTGI